MGQQRSSSLYVGAVKTNVSHLEGAAGIAGLLKAPVFWALAMWKNHRISSKGRLGNATAPSATEFALGQVEPTHRRGRCLSRLTAVGKKSHMLLEWPKIPMVRRTLPIKHLWGDTNRVECVRMLTWSSLQSPWFNCHRRGRLRGQVHDKILGIGTVFLNVSLVFS